MLYDSTLRDGEQMPHVSFSLEQKVDIARMLAHVGVRQIEAGFPAVSSGERAAVKEIASLDTGSEILALSRCCNEDIDAAVDCGVDMVMLFMASSDLHLKYKLRMSRQEVKEKVAGALEHASERGIKFSFSTEDSTRTELKFLMELSTLAEKMGACRIGLADTTGCIMPRALGDLVGRVVGSVNVPVSVHLHDDLGLGLANALASIENGASAVATTVNGIGERAGNVPLEQLAVALKVLYGIDTGIDTTKLVGLCNKVSEFSGIPISPNSPWTGENVFRHESGIHVAAMDSDPRTYECVPPEFVGASREFVLGKHSGRFSVRRELDICGIKSDETGVEAILRAVKAAAQDGKIVDRRLFLEIVEKVK